MGAVVILVDTNVLIDFDHYEFDLAQSYVASMLSRAELELGIRRAPSITERESRQTKLALLDDWVDWLPFDRAASEGYGVVAGGSALTGARLRGKDALIAGQAYSLGASLMTVNTADFAAFAAVLTIVAPTPRA